MSSTTADVNNLTAAFAVIDREIARVVEVIVAVRAIRESTPPKRPRTRSTPRKAA